MGKATVDGKCGVHGACARTKVGWNQASPCKRTVSADSRFRKSKRARWSSLPSLNGEASESGLDTYPTQKQNVDYFCTTQSTKNQNFPNERNYNKESNITTWKANSNRGNWILEFQYYSKTSRKAFKIRKSNDRNEKRMRIQWWTDVPWDINIFPCCSTRWCATLQGLEILKISIIGSEGGFE